MATPKKANPKNKGGPKKVFIITPKIIEEIEALAEDCLTQRDMCDYYGISEDTWYFRKREHPEIGEALRRGKVKTKRVAVGTIRAKMREGDVPAARFFLSTQCKWNENNTAPMEDEDPRELTLGTNDPVEAAQVYQDIMMGN